MRTGMGSIFSIFIAVAILALSSNSAYANWDDTEFGQLELKKDLIMEGSLKEVDFSFTLYAKILTRDEVKDSLYIGRHLISFSINGVSCQGISILSKDDEAPPYSYYMAINYDTDQREKGCPWFVQVYFGQMNEDREGVVDTKLTIYHEADFQSKETIRGKLTKF